ncbi:MAG: fumarylacetoacetate hydrolase family protein [Gammaproteobacteria bacterium]|jgi:fumarylacetoacetate (FAA) hydrolase|nr:fumarylacetoacetate hydrolase family protein [Gammaproteobacteria bacterium]
MKLASLKNHTHDGKLVVVAKDLKSYKAVPDISPTLQCALDDWANIAPKLEAVYTQLNAGDAQGAEPFDQAKCNSPLPRAFHWADGSAYVNHVELVRRARGAELPATFWQDPLIYQGGSDSFLGPHDNIELASEDFGIDFEAEIAVILSHTQMGAPKDQVDSNIKLLMLVNDVSLRNLIPAELAKGFGFYQSKPSSAFSPVAVTPDELGTDWCDGKINLPLLSTLNGQAFGTPDAGVDMTFNFYELISHAAKTRPLTAGSIIGSGTVSNKSPDGGPGKAVTDGGKGYSCIAELRMIETINYGKPKTSYMQYGDQIQIEMLDKNGASIFGAIKQELVPYVRADNKGN